MKLNKGGSFHKGRKFVFMLTFFFPYKTPGDSTNCKNFKKERA